MSTRYVTGLAIGAAVGGFLFGFDTSTMNSAIVGINSTLQLSAAAMGFVAAIALIGCAVGAWFAGPVAAKRGRNRVMLIAGLLITAGSFGSAFAPGTIILGAVRFLTGLGIGAASAVVPGYIAEISPTRIRGRLGTFWQFAIVFGQFAGLIVGYVLAQLAGSEIEPMPWGGTAWRWMFICVAIPAIVYILIVRTLPRSPHDLVRFGKADDARDLLGRIGDTPADREIEDIQQAITGSQVASLGDLRGPRLGLKPIVWIGILLAAFQQLVGINVVKTYSNAIWQAVGYSTADAFTISIVTVSISIVATIIAILIMDRVGRKTLLASGAVVMTIALIVLAISFSSAGGTGDDRSLDGRSAIGALIAVNTFAIAFGITWGPVMWLMLNELFDTNLRTSAVAVCTAANWLTNWLVTRTFPLLAGLGLSTAYGLYAVFSALAVGFVLKALPETRGRALD